MPFMPSRIGLFVPVVLLWAGCCAVTQPKGKSPLQQPRMSPDSVVLDILFVRFPFGDEQANVSLWQEIDEQHFAAPLRRQLAAQGFRVGLVGGQIPVKLAQMLQLSDRPASAQRVNQVSLQQMESDPLVIPRHLQLRAGRHAEIIASGIYDELPVLMCESGQLCGRSYPKAQGVFALKAFPEPGGRVRLELVPELHYGEPRRRYVPSHGGFRLEVGKPRRVFDKLAISAHLAPGQMLILSSLACRQGSLGHHFFTHDTAGQLEQKLLVIRLSQIQHDDLFAPEGILPLDD